MYILKAVIKLIVKLIYKTHLNFITAGLISEFFLDPNKISTKFNFLRNKESYKKYYQDMFLKYHIKNKRRSNDNINFKYIRRLGILRPLSGHEIKNIPLFSHYWKHGYIHRITDQYVKEPILDSLHFKIFPNWTITFDDNLFNEFGILKLDCKPRINLYPDGLVSYQMTFSLKFNGIESSKFISLISKLQNKEIYKIKNKTYTLDKIILEIHHLINSDIIGNNYNKINLNRFTPIHCITTIKESDDLDPNKDLDIYNIVLQNNFKNLDLSANSIPKYIPGLLTRQFFIFHTKTSFFYPADPSSNNEKNFRNYIIKCLRINLSSLIEIATLYSAFISFWKHNINELENIGSDFSIYLLKESTWLKSTTDWDFTGIHSYFYDIVCTKLKLRKRAEDLIEQLEKKETKHKIKFENNILNEDSYNNIIKVIDIYCKGCEKYPSLFRDRDEEDLRDQILLNLQTHIHDPVSAETFNKAGKTDIIIKKENNNIFVAECKIWKGQSEFKKAIDQLLSYLTWRDSKTALILFVQEQNMISIIKKIKEEVKKHDKYLDIITDNHSNIHTLFYINEKECKIDMTIMAYHFNY